MKLIHLYPSARDNYKTTKQPFENICNGVCFDFVKLPLALVLQFLKRDLKRDCTTDAASGIFQNFSNVHVLNTFRKDPSPKVCW